jgi:hypothetical protein
VPYLTTSSLLRRRDLLDKFNCILYGESGTGKTPLLGTLEACERTAPCLFLDVDMGTMSLNDAKPKPTIVSLDSFTMLEAMYPLLKEQKWDKIAEGLSKRAGYEIPVQAYKSIAIDSGTELEYVLRRSIVGADDRQEGIPDQPHYLKTQERFKVLYRKLRDLPITVVMTAGIRELKEESTGVVKRFPDFQPGICHDLVRMTDLIMFMASTAEGTGKDAKWERTLVTSSSKRFIARDRSQKLQPQMTAEKFYFKDICAKILS